MTEMETTTAKDGSRPQLDKLGAAGSRGKSTAPVEPSRHSVYVHRSPRAVSAGSAFCS